MTSLSPRATTRALWSGIALGLLATITAILTTPLTGADTLVQSFKTKSTLQPGWVVAVSKSAPDTIELAPANDLARIYGVVIDPSEAPVTLQRQNNQIFVATNGNYKVLVSTQNGSINPGDFLSLSSINGIAAKATPKQLFVLGQALEGFDGQGGSLTTDKNGFAIGQVKTALAHIKNPLLKDDILLPQSLRKVGQTIAGNTNISAIRLYAALIALTATAILSFSVLWIGIRSGMVAIGRNPLSQHSILKGLLQVALTSILIFIIGLFGVYLLLRL